MSLYFPAESAIVYYEQAGFTVSSTTQFFDWEPTSTNNLLANTAFVQHVRDECERTVNSGHDLLQQLVGQQRDSVRSIFDLGCGLAWTDLAMYKALDPKPTLYLMDTSYARQRDLLNPASKNREWEEHHYTADLNLTREFLEGNGVKPEHIVFIEPMTYQCFPHIYPVDIITSFSSWGLLYPIEIYWHGIEGMLHPSSVVSTHLRKDHAFELDFFKRNFLDVEVYDENESLWFIVAKQPEWMFSQ